MDEKPNYFAIIPANVRYDNNLSANEKLLYGEITALSNKNGQCYASNKYFASLYNMHENSIGRCISNLKNNGYITLGLNKEVVFDGKEPKSITKRIIKIIENKSTIKLPQVNTNVATSQHKCLQQVNTKVEYNKINNNKINNIFDYLNNTLYKNDFDIKLYLKFNITDIVINLINNLYDKGFTEKDFKDVIWYVYDTYVENEFKFEDGNSSKICFTPASMFKEKNFVNYLNKYRISRDG